MSGTVRPRSAARAARGGAIPPGPGGLPRPAWMDRLVDRLEGTEPGYFSRFLPPDDEPARQSAVLMLFGPAPDSGSVRREGPAAGPDEHVLLIERAHDMRSHPAQVAFPGGARDPEDEDVVATALREAQEETGLDPAGVQVVSVLPSLFLPPSRFVVSPVLAWWSEPSPVGVVDVAEVHEVLDVPVAHLVDPSTRYSVRHPSGFTGPAFDIDDLVLWGFTAGLLSSVLELAGLARPWDHATMRPLPDRFLGPRG